MIAPMFFRSACLLAAGVVVLHLIVPREPPGATLPTARFVSRGPSVVRALASRPADRAVMLLRVIAILLIGLAFARPHLIRSRTPLVTIVVTDRSRAVADESDVVEATRAAVDGSTAVLIPFDTTASVVTGATLQDTLNHLARTPARGSMTAALIMALRVAGQWRDRADSMRLVVISPARADEADAALDGVRALWPGTVQLVRVRPASEAPSSTGAAARVDWPADGRASGAGPRAPIDTVGALIVGDVVVVRPFERRWHLDTSGARVIGRWVDGQAAIVERAARPGCERQVAVAFDTTQVMVRDPGMRRVLEIVHRPCGAELRLTPVSIADTAWERPGGRTLVASATLASADARPEPVAVIVLALGLVALFVEWRLRARARWQ